MIFFPNYLKIFCWQKVAIFQLFKNCQNECDEIFYNFSINIDWAISLTNIDAKVLNKMLKNQFNNILKG